MRNSAKFFLLLFFINISYLAAQQEKLDYFTYPGYSQENKEFTKFKKAKVKTRIRSAAFYDKNEKLPSKFTITEKLSFNKAGNPTKRIYYKYDGSINSQYLYKYDKNNKLIKMEVMDEFGNAALKREIKYTKNRDTLEIVSLNLQKSSSDTKKFYYDKNGKLTEKLFYDSKNNIYLKENYLYDGNNLTAVESFDGRGKKVSITNLMYNNSGNLEKKIIDNIEKQFSYDDKNRFVKEVENDKVRIYKYDDNNNIVDDQFFIEHNKRQFRVSFDYRKNGLVNQAIRYDGKDKKAFCTKFEYEYYK